MAVKEPSGPVADVVPHIEQRDPERPRAPTADLPQDLTTPSRVSIVASSCETRVVGFHTQGLEHRIGFGSGRSAAGLCRELLAGLSPGERDPGH
jgi:hypothetical protein